MAPRNKPPISLTAMEIIKDGSNPMTDSTLTIVSFTSTSSNCTSVVDIHKITTTSQMDKRRQSSSSNEEKDVDKGWAWVVLFASFTSLVIFGGQQYGFANYFVAFLDEFGESRSYTSWAGGLQAAVFHICGPLSSILLPIIGSRAVTLIGGLTMALGFLLVHFATSMLYIILVYGILVGIGSCFVLTGSLASCARFFDKRLFIANGVSFSGTGVGFLTVGLASEYLIKAYGWRGSMFIQAGISLQVCIFAMLVFDKVAKRPRPLQKVITVVDNNLKSSVDFESTTDATNSINCDAHVDTKNADKTQPIVEYFKDLRFWCLNFSTLLVNMGCLSVLIFFKDMLMDKQLDIYGYILIALGSGSTFGRFSGGFVSNYINPMLFYFIAATVNTVNVLVFPMINDLTGFAIVAFVFGMCQGYGAVLQSIQLIQVYGRRELPKLWGFGMSYGSIGVITGPPIFGFIKDKSGHFDGSLYMCAIAIFFAGVFGAVVYVIERLRISRLASSCKPTMDVECPKKIIYT